MGMTVSQFHDLPEQTRLALKMASRSISSAMKLSVGNSRVDDKVLVQSPTADPSPDSVQTAGASVEVSSHTISPIYVYSQLYLQYLHELTHTAPDC